MQAFLTGVGRFSVTDLSRVKRALSHRATRPGEAAQCIYDPAMPTTHDQLVAANDATYEAWNAHDPDAVAAVFPGTPSCATPGTPSP